MNISPLILERKLDRRLWGGTTLANRLGVPAESGGEPLAEAWLAYEENLITEGPHAGRSLASLAQEMGASLLGTATMSRYGRKFPLLTKLIDAARPLSIQVHPDDAYAQANEQGSGSLGKAEAWYILAADPGASIVWGFERGVTPDEVRGAIREENLEELVRRVDVTSGDVIYNPPGTVHAIGAGILLFEVQQTSDLTYRLYDYGRRDASGQQRELHLEKSLDVADLSGAALAKVAPLDIGPGHRLLIETDYFAMESIGLQGEPVSLETSAASMEILTLLGDSAVIGWDGGEIELPESQAVILPASLGRYRLAGQGEVVRCHLPVR